MKILIDTAEQRAFTFLNINADHGGRIHYTKEKQKLRNGDYSVEGLTHEITVERKSLNDFQSSILSDRKRFEGCVERMRDEVTVGHIVCPCDPTFKQFKKTTAVILRQTVCSWTLKYPNIHWWFMGTRRGAEVWTFRLLHMAWRKFYE